MRALVNHRGARAISLALVAGLLAFEAVLALHAGAIGVPGFFLLRFTEEEAAQSKLGGETVIAKLDEIPPARPRATEPIAASPETPATSGEPNLAGLAEIPLGPLLKQEAKPDEHGDEQNKGQTRPLGPDVKGREELPWDAIEPVPPPSETSATASDALAPETATPEPSPAPKVTPVQLPAAGAVEGWVKAKATEIKGEAREHPLYDFELWLDAPAEVKQRLVAVAYDFNTPAVMPQMQVSREQKTGFRIRVGALACADKITVTLKFKDGQSQQVAIDGCRLLG
jgi:hypothetical protein